MRRILHLADLHLSEHATLGGIHATDADGVPALLSDAYRAVVSVIDQATDNNNLDGVVFVGDTFDRRVPTPAEVTVAERLVRHAARRCEEGAVVVMDGNHETTRRTGRVSALADLRVARDVVRHVGASGPEVVGYAGIYWAVVPYPHRAAVRESLADEELHRLSAKERNGLLSQAVEAVVLGLRARIPKGFARLLLLHTTIQGATVGEQPRPIAGDIQLSTTACLRWDAVLGGHIHQQQEVIPGAYFSGSPYIRNFGEIADPPKGGLLWTFEDDGTPVAVQPVVAEGGRPWRIVQAEDVLHGTVTFEPDGTVWSVRGEIDLAPLQALRDVVVSACGRGCYVQNTVRPKVEERVTLWRPDEEEKGKAWTDRERVRRALESRASDGDDEEIAACLELWDEHCGEMAHVD